MCLKFSPKIKILHFYISEIHFKNKILKFCIFEIY